MRLRLLSPGPVSLLTTITSDQMPIRTRSQTARSSATHQRPQGKQTVVPRRKPQNLQREDSLSYGNEQMAQLQNIPASSILDHPDDPPRYTIDLSLTPSQRYVQLATDFKPVLSSLDLKRLFDDVAYVLLPWLPVSGVRFLSRLMLRKVYDAEETEELRGISRACGIEMYLLVALNTFLDLLMGCTSGGVRIKEGVDVETKMLHFRTLDWGMDELRKLVVQLDFVKSPGGDVIARSITYAGFVGVLTGIRSVEVPYHHDLFTKLDHDDDYTGRVFRYL